METVIFKKTGLYYLTKFMFIKDANDTCTYRMQLVLSSALFILSLHGSIIRAIFSLNKNWREDDDHWGILPHLLFTLGTSLALLLGYCVIEGRFIGSEDYLNWHSLSYFMFFIYTFVALIVGILAIGTFAIITIILIAIGGGILKLYEWMMSSIHIGNNDDVEHTTQLGILYQSLKEKWCKRIIWK